MKISELGRRAGVPLSTLKFYIREGLLPPGERTGPNQARYGTRHLSRLDLIRALREIFGLRNDAIRRVLDALEHPEAGAEPIRTALAAMDAPAPQRTPAQEAAYGRALAEVETFLDGLDWTLPGRHGEFAERLADALLRLRELVDPGLGADVLAPYARAAWALSEVEFGVHPHGEPIEPRPGDDLAYPTKMALLGTVLMEPVVIAMRRYALNARGTRDWEELPIPPAKPIA